MHIQDILTTAIVAIPTCYAALLAVQFASGLTRLGNRTTAPAVGSVAPQQPATEQAEVDPWDESKLSQCVCDTDGIRTLESLYLNSHTHFLGSGQGQPIALLPAATATPVALLPAFIPNPNSTDAAAEDAALVETVMEAIGSYWSRQVTHNIVEFKRPVRAIQKPQQQHPALESMTLRAMRQMGAELRIKGARRWNTEQARAALSRYYQTAA